jgi:5-methylcytosine-specific restriction endonuclease McrA
VNFLGSLRRLAFEKGVTLSGCRHLMPFCGAEEVVKPILMEMQSARCFYCAAVLKEPSAEVDHFIPWSRYSADLVHNLVLADRRCNSKKRDRIAHVDHLAK